MTSRTRIRATKSEGGLLSWLSEERRAGETGVPSMSSGGVSDQGSVCLEASTEQPSIAQSDSRAAYPQQSSIISRGVRPSTISF